MGRGDWHIDNERGQRFGDDTSRGQTFAILTSSSVVTQL